MKTFPRKTIAILMPLIIETLCEGESAAERKTIRDHYRNLDDVEATKIIKRVLEETERIIESEDET